MATRNLTMVINRKYAEDSSLGFAENPVGLSDKSYVNMYQHHFCKNSIDFYQKLLIINRFFFKKT